MLGEVAYPFGGYGTFVPLHKEIPQNTDRIAPKSLNVVSLQSLYEVDNPPDHRPQEQSIDR